VKTKEIATNLFWATLRAPTRQTKVHGGRDPWEENYEANLARSKIVAKTTKYVRGQRPSRKNGFARTNRGRAGTGGTKGGGKAGERAPVGKKRARRGGGDHRDRWRHRSLIRKKTLNVPDYSSKQGEKREGPKHQRVLRKL